MEVCRKYIFNVVWMCRGCGCRASLPYPPSATPAPTWTRQVTNVPHSRGKIVFLWSDQCCGSGMFVPDPGSEFSIPDPGSKKFRIRIRIQEFKYFNPKNRFYACGKIIWDVHPGFGFFPHPGPWIRIPVPGVKKKHRIRYIGSDPVLLTFYNILAAPKRYVRRVTFW